MEHSLIKPYRHFTIHIHFMKTKFTIILLLAFAAFSCSSNKSDLERNNIKGKVWKIQTTYFEGKEVSGKYITGFKRSFGHGLNVFDEDGKFLEFHRLNEEGQSEQIQRATYNSDNICTEINTFENDKLTERQVFLIKDEVVTGGKIYDRTGKQTYHYEYTFHNGDITEVKGFNEIGKLVSYNQGEFTKGLVHRETYKDSLGDITAVINYTRNQEGDIIEKSTKYPKDNSEYKQLYSYEYDSKRNWIRRYEFDDEGKISDILVQNIIYYDDPEIRNEHDFSGIWFVINDTDWIEIRKDKKYDIGYNDKISESGIWEIDTDNSVITFRANSPNDSRKYKYEFEGSQLVFRTIQGKEKLRLERR